MEYLYSGPLVKYMEDWLDSYDTDILTTAALALGNFARTDAHCIEMVERSTATKLLGKYMSCDSYFRRPKTNQSTPPFPPPLPHPIHL